MTAAWNKVYISICSAIFSAWSTSIPRLPNRSIIAVLARPAHLRSEDRAYEHHSGLSPAAWTTFDHFSISALMYVPACSGVPPM